MGGCVAFGCPNRSEHGFCLKAFPRDPERRAIWAANVNRKNWTPSDGSRLCEMHFAPCMWEVDREDGKRKLKVDAIPTQFSFHCIKNHIKLPVPIIKSKTCQRMVYYEPSMWDVDQATGKRKLKPDAVPSLSMVKRIKLPTPVSPKKLMSDHNYIIKTEEGREGSLTLPCRFMSEVYVVDTQAQDDDAVSNGAVGSVNESDLYSECGKQFAPRLKTYFNKRKRNNFVKS